jgi:hypothetical protein
LDVSENRLRTLPAGIGALMRLRELDVSENEVRLCACACACVRVCACVYMFFCVCVRLCVCVCVRELTRKGAGGDFFVTGAAAIVT